MSIEHGPNPEGREQSEGRFRVGVESVASERHPERNEDAFIALPDRGAFAVLDGVSGEFETGAGKIGSRTAADALYAVIRKLSPAATLAERQEQARGLLEQAHVAVQTVRREKKIDGAKSTAALGLVHREGNRTFLVTDNIGDSRIYTMRHDGQLEPITIDDYLLAWAGNDEAQARQLQKKLDEVSRASELPPAEREIFTHRNDPAQRLGDSRELRHHLRVVELNPGDRILLTSDGIHDNLTSQEITELLQARSDPNRAASALIDAACERSRDAHHVRAKPDDMTAIVVEPKF